jgi:ADP-ribose pyrophosphatase YjhB (NUDIX family)
MIKYCGHCGAPLATRERDGRLRAVCPECDWTLYEDPKVAVAVIVCEEGRLLLNRRAIEPGLGSWSFPSGYVNRGEELEEAAAREVKEETGLDVVVGGLVGVYSESGNPVVLIVYTAASWAGTPASGDEVSEIGWFEPERLPPLAFEHDYRIIAEWVRTGGSRGASTTPAR